MDIFQCGKPENLAKSFNPFHAAAVLVKQNAVTG